MTSEGSGKSNVAFNLSFKLIEDNEGLSKIFYIYPFNTLVEQNLRTIEKVFENDENIMSNVAVVNSLFPISEGKNNLSRTEDKLYEKNKDVYKLLDRQFLNYPIVLSTHVMLFKTLFGNKREDCFAFHQLCNSVIVLDEIQSYKIDIWSEIILFLTNISELLNIKIIIMSATLPKLNLLLSDTVDNTVYLINDRKKYFSNTIFKDRVSANYELLKFNKSEVEDKIIEKLKEFLGKKILVEFITKKSSEDFYKKLVDLFKQENIGHKVILLSGNTTLSDRKKAIELINEMNDIIVISTQVIEAGVDIDMDIGFKNISILDSEEQFMGRINRSSKKKNSEVYFFYLDDPSLIYKNDPRTDKSFLLKEEAMQNFLSEKSFDKYYMNILDWLKNRKTEMNDNNIDEFKNQIAILNMTLIAKKMTLIDDVVEKVNLFLSRNINIDGEEMKGNDVWSDYKELLSDSDMEYSTKMVKLHNLRTIMSNFIYPITRNEFYSLNINFNDIDVIGDTIFIEESEKYFENGVFIKDLLKENSLII